MREVVALEQQWMAGCDGQGVGEAIADVQRGTVMAFAEAPKGVDSNHRLLGGNGGDLCSGQTKERLEVIAAGSALSPLDDERRLNSRHR